MRNSLCGLSGERPSSAPWLLRRPRSVPAPVLPNPLRSARWRQATPGGPRTTDPSAANDNTENSFGTCEAGRSPASAARVKPCPGQLCQNSRCSAGPTLARCPAKERPRSAAPLAATEPAPVLRQAHEARGQRQPAEGRKEQSHELRPAMFGPCADKCNINNALHFMIRIRCSSIVRFLDVFGKTCAEVPAACVSLVGPRVRLRRTHPFDPCLRFARST